MQDVAVSTTQCWGYRHDSDPFTAYLLPKLRLGQHRSGTSARRAPKGRQGYLGDPRRAAPERLRTIIRQPVA
jgi:hypothetical protein